MLTPDAMSEGSPRMMIIISLVDNTINHPVSDSEVQDTDEEHK